MAKAKQNSNIRLLKCNNDDMDVDNNDNNNNNSNNNDSKFNIIYKHWINLGYAKFQPLRLHYKQTNGELAEL